MLSAKRYHGALLSMACILFYRPTRINTVIFPKVGRNSDGTRKVNTNKPPPPPIRRNVSSATTEKVYVRVIFSFIFYFFFNYVRRILEKRVRFQHNVYAILYATRPGTVLGDSE